MTGRAEANRGDGSAIAWSHTKVLMEPRIRKHRLAYPNTAA